MTPTNLAAGVKPKGLMLHPGPESGGVFGQGIATTGPHDQERLPAPAADPNLNN